MNSSIMPLHTLTTCKPFTAQLTINRLTHFYGKTDLLNPVYRHDANDFRVFVTKKKKTRQSLYSQYNDITFHYNYTIYNDDKV